MQKTQGRFGTFRERLICSGGGKNAGERKGDWNQKKKKKKGTLVLAEMSRKKRGGFRD